MALIHFRSVLSLYKSLAHFAVGLVIKRKSVGSDESRFQTVEQSEFLI